MDTQEPPLQRLLFSTALLLAVLGVPLAMLCAVLLLEQGVLKDWSEALNFAGLLALAKLAVAALLWAIHAQLRKGQQASQNKGVSVS